MNEVAEHTISARWLNEWAPGFAELPLPDRTAIFDFAFLWSLFEGRVMNKYARADRIRERVDEWTANGTLAADLYDVELDYFRIRYFVDGQFSHNFEHLHLRDSDHPQLVQAVLQGVNNEPRDRMLALLMIIWRLRNNLFHGVKWEYHLRDQRENFGHANQVLVRLLECHGRLG